MILKEHGYRSSISIKKKKNLDFSWAFSGYLIPKGWKVLPLFRNIHHSPDNYTDPEKFDPSRFEVLFIELAKNRKEKKERIGTRAWNIGNWHRCDLWVAHSIIMVIEFFIF